MSGIGRRLVLTGLGAVGLGALGYGGSLAACRMGDSREAMLRPLFIALDRVPEPERLGRAWLETEGWEQAANGLLARRDLIGAALLPDAGARRDAIGTAIRADFARSETVLVDGWVVALSEARLAAAWRAIG